MEKAKILQAIDALRALDKFTAINLIKQEFEQTPNGHPRLQSIAKLAENIGEIDLALDAAEAFADGTKTDVSKQLFYMGQLATYGRTDRAIAHLKSLDPSIQKDLSVLHFQATISSQLGKFDEAEAIYRKILKISPCAPQTWFALAMLVKFDSRNDDIHAILNLLPTVEKLEPDTLSRFLYCIAKLHMDIGEVEEAFQYYHRGAEIKRRELPYDRIYQEDLTKKIIEGFDITSISKLCPSGEKSSRPIFVTGLPRTGSTLIEQILTAHSAISDGGEMGIFKAALLPVGRPDMPSALLYQQRIGIANDPWGQVGKDYLRMLQMWFPEGQHVVDKTLLQSQFMGFILHSLPNAKVIWMRRNPADSALSCFRSYFSSSIPWCWSFSDIGHFFRLEDQLFNHWTSIFPDRILVVPYEDFVSRSNYWIVKIFDHLDLAPEPVEREFYKTSRSVRTASVKQVRQPISEAGIGTSEPYTEMMTEFFEEYRK